MDHPQCDHVRAALLQALTNSHQPAQTPALAQHIAHCSACQDLRASVFQQLLPSKALPADPCALCQLDLAAYVDMNLDAGTHTAALAYPQVWWHLWTCRDCAKIFAQTAALAGAERAGVLTSIPVARVTPTNPRHVIGRLSVAPQVVARFIQSRALLGVAYGDETPMVLDDGEDNIHSFQLSVQRGGGGTWQVLVSVVPPVAGVAVITVGQTTYHVPFDAQGFARVADMPSALLLAGESAIAVAIEAV
ncbi:hypothetical protein K2Z83_19755 [Oscillochloris sp. ZM17-4]|uniref:hypothetical protein n=1 Tax=Oscillochloris sp. ZM17-4 TaxID=2866714 RepID=UPI001C73198B|nr:hypothetical protein [Oscillochloris sp. ZM17-4]MBX0329904.1 hypothetical protein [Oscillochloris sp. ZM17-4]